MRIDLIPDILDTPLSSRPQQVGGGPSATSRQAAVPQPGSTGRIPSVEGADQRPYAALFDSIYDAGLMVDPHGRIRDVNRRAIEHFGYTRDELCGHCVWDVISGASEALLRTLFDALQGGERFTLLQAYCIRQDGTTFPAEIAVSELHLGGTRICFFVRDITQRRQTEEMLRTEHNALQNAVEAIVVTGADGNLEYVNPATLHIWRIPSADRIVGAPLGELFVNPDDADSLLKSLNGENYQCSGEVWAKRPDGSRFIAELNAACNRNSDGAIVGAVVSLSKKSEIA